MMAKSQPDYAFKSYLITSGIFNDFRIANYNVFKHNDNYDISFDYLFKMRMLDFNSYKECYKINHSLYHRNMRVRQKIQNILINYDKCYFLTLTFTDSILASTSEETRRRYVARWLKDNCIEYLANIDYGKEKGREHYHAVGTFKKKVDYTSFNGGSVNSKIIINKNAYKLKNYINKLTYHAMKETTKQVRLIYSRNVK